MSDAREMREQAARTAGTGTTLPVAVTRSNRATRRKFLPKLLRLAGRIPFADDLAAAYYAAIDPKTPRKAKGVLLAALAYFVVPADAMPDFVVGLGFTDDATVLATALGIVGAHVKEPHRRAARKLLGLKEPAPEAADAPANGA